VFSPSYKAAYKYIGRSGIQGRYVLLVAVHSEALLLSYGAPTTRGFPEKNGADQPNQSPALVLEAFR